MCVANLVTQPGGIGGLEITHECIAPPTLIKTNKGEDINILFLCRQQLQYGTRLQCNEVVPSLGFRSGRTVYTHIDRERRSCSGLLDDAIDSLHTATVTKKKKKIPYTFTMNFSWIQLWSQLRIPVRIVLHTTKLYVTFHCKEGVNIVPIHQLTHTLQKFIHNSTVLDNIIQYSVTVSDKMTFSLNVQC